MSAVSDDDSDKMLELQAAADTAGCTTKRRTAGSGAVDCPLS